MDFKEINERLKDILAADGKKNSIKDIDVARAIGINPNTYAQMKYRNSPPYKEIMDFLARKKISINLFFYNQELKNEDKKYKVLRMFNVKASLGGGANNEDEEFEEVVVDDKIMERFRRGNVKEMYRCDIITAIGESMEPHILEGDMCIIGIGMPYVDGEVYAVHTPDGLVIKECYKQGEELVLVSYNPIYTPVRHQECECEIIGRYLGIFRSENIKWL